MCKVNLKVEMIVVVWRIILWLCVLFNRYVLFFKKGNLFLICYNMSMDMIMNKFKIKFYFLIY